MVTLDASHSSMSHRYLNIKWHISIYFRELHNLSSPSAALWGHERVAGGLRAGPARPGGSSITCAIFDEVLLVLSYSQLEKMSPLSGTYCTVKAERTFKTNAPKSSWAASLSPATTTAPTGLMISSGTKAPTTPSL